MCHAGCLVRDGLGRDLDKEATSLELMRISHRITRGQSHLDRAHCGNNKADETERIQVLPVSRGMRIAVQGAFGAWREIRRVGFYSESNGKPLEGFKHDLIMRVFVFQ